MHNPPGLPKYSWRDRTANPTLFYVTDHHEANFLLACLPRGPVGFDLEWRPNFRKGQPENPVALVQLATADAVILFHVHHMTRFPVRLAELLGSPSWTKVGVSIQHDCEKLFNDYGLTVRNCVELSLLARTVDNARWKGRYTNPLGLARLVETYERAILVKGKVQRSNWERCLSTSQREYAASDAHAGYVVYSRLLEMAQEMHPVPPPAYYTFSFVNGHLCDRFGISPWEACNPCYDPGPLPLKREDTDEVDHRTGRLPSSASDD